MFNFPDGKKSVLFVMDDANDELFSIFLNFLKLTSSLLKYVSGKNDRTSFSSFEQMIKTELLFFVFPQ
jgi:hypothetical protein